MIIIVTKEELRHAHRVMRGKLLKHLAEQAKGLAEYNARIVLPYDFPQYGGIEMSSSDGKVVSFDYDRHYRAHDLPTWVLREFEKRAQDAFCEIL